MGRTTWGRAAAQGFVVALVSAVAMGVPAAASAASKQPAPPPTLTGEELTFITDVASVKCSNTGQVSYTASGTATGPYPGTLTASGTGTVSLLSPLGPNTHLSALNATFSIDSPVGTVTGTVTLGSSYSGCLNASNQFGFYSDDNYQATIHTATGNYTDSGATAVEVFGPNGGDAGIYDQSFASSQTQTTLIAPTSASQCMNGGYKNYPQFKNQGQCISSLPGHS